MQDSYLYAFGPFLLDAGQRLVLRDGEPVPLPPKAVDTLLPLVRNAGRLVGKDDLMGEVWPDAFVEEVNLAKNIFLLRQALGNGEGGREYIETVPKRGYRFVASVSRQQAPATETEPPTAAVVTRSSNGHEAAAKGRGFSPAEKAALHPVPVAPSAQFAITNGAESATGEQAETCYNGGAEAPPFPVGGEKPFPVGGEKLSIPAPVLLPSAQEATAAVITKPRPWLRVTLPFAAVLVVALGWFWLSPSPQPTVLKTAQITHIGRVVAASPLVMDGMRIYFVERNGGRLTLAAVPVEGGEPVPVTTPFPDVVLYDISPDHSELLVGSEPNNEDETNLWMLPTAGGSPRRLGNIVGRDAAWSPDAQKIAYFSGSGIYVVKPDGTDSRRLGTTQGKPRFSRWSPDGHLLRFSLMTYPVFDVSLWEVTEVGGGPHRLLPGWRGLPAYYGDGELGGDWTPDGRYFVFRSTRAGFASIWAIREGGGFLDGSSRAPVQLITTDLTVWGVRAAKNKIFYTGDKAVRELARYDARSKQFVPCLHGVRASGVSFSPDGRWVAYVVSNGQQGILWKSKADGTGAQQLTFAPLVALDQQWSPDGTQIALTGVLPGKPAQVFRVPSAGGEPEPVTSFPSVYPAWSSDGDRLFFTAPVPLPAAGQAAPSGTEPPKAGTYQLDLRTRQISPLPGAEALKALSCSPDGRYQIARTGDGGRLMLFDLGSRRWSELARGEDLSVGLWSRDGKYVYFQDVSQGESQPIFRVRISDRRTERVATLEQIARADVRNYFLVGLAPDDSPVVSLVLGHSDIYELDLNLP